MKEYLNQTWALREGTKLLQGLNSFIPCMKFARAALPIPTSTTSVCSIFVYSVASVWDFLTCTWMMMQAIAHWSCKNIIRGSALKGDSGRKIPHHTRELNPNQSSTWLFGPISLSWAVLRYCAISHHTGLWANTYWTGWNRFWLWLQLTPPYTLHTTTTQMEQVL